jgi:4-hydroxy-tetrahydrodipicolinate reductase
VLVDGTPTIDMTIAGGVPGDSATAALVVNSLPKLMAARPGFLTMRDLPLIHCFNPQELGALPARKR